jgi:hypothetical protein
MASPGSREILEELNQKQTFRYLYTSKEENIDNVGVSITRPGNKDVLPKSRHKITGSLNEIHSLYLAIENYLRIERLLGWNKDVCRVSRGSVQKLYPVYVVTEKHRLPYWHRDGELDVGDDCDDGDRDTLGRLAEKSIQIREIVKEQLSGVYEYYKAFDSKQLICFNISTLPKRNMLQLINIKTKYFDSSQKLIAEKCTDVDYTMKDLEVLRFAVLDFLRYHVPVLNEFEILRSVPSGDFKIESRIQRHQALPKLLKQK